MHCTVVYLTWKLWAGLLSELALFCCHTSWLNLLAVLKSQPCF